MRRPGSVCHPFFQGALAAPVTVSGVSASKAEKDGESGHCGMRDVCFRGTGHVATRALQRRIDAL